MGPSLLLWGGRKQGFALELSSLEPGWRRQGESGQGQELETLEELFCSFAEADQLTPEAPVACLRPTSFPCHLALEDDPAGMTAEWAWDSPRQLPVPEQGLCHLKGNLVSTCGIVVGPRGGFAHYHL